MPPLDHRGRRRASRIIDNLPRMYGQVIQAAVTCLVTYEIMQECKEPQWKNPRHWIAAHASPATSLPLIDQPKDCSPRVPPQEQQHRALLCTVNIRIVTRGTGLTAIPRRIRTVMGGARHRIALTPCAGRREPTNSLAYGPPTLARSASALLHTPFEGSHRPNCHTTSNQRKASEECKKGPPASRKARKSSVGKSAKLALLFLEKLRVPASARFS